MTRERRLKLNSDFNKGTSQSATVTTYYDDTPVFEVHFDFDTLAVTTKVLSSPRSISIGGQVDAINAAYFMVDSHFTSDHTPITEMTI